MSGAWLVGSLAIYFAVLLAVAMFKRRSATEEDYFLAGRAMPSWSLGLAFIATWYGANSALISVDKAFESGLVSWWVLGGPTVLAVIALIALAPAIRRVGSVSQNGIMASRYNATAGNLLSVVLTIYLIFWGASQMVAIGGFFASFFGIGYATAVILGTAVSLVYSISGGFRAVVLTETIQFVLLLAGLIVTVVVAVVLAGGPHNIGQAVAAVRGPGYFNLFSGIGANLTYIISFGLAFTIDGAAWQRIQAARSPRGARLAAVTAMGGFVPLYFLVVFTGIASVAVFARLPEGGIVSALVRDHMSPLLGSIVFVGIAAAIMSTICTTLNLGSLYMAELFVKYVRPAASERAKVRYGRIGTALAAAVGFVVAVRLPSALNLLSLASEVLAAGLFVPLILGFFWRRGTSTGAVAAIVAGGGFILYGFVIELGVPLPAFWEGDATRILIGMGMSFVAYVAVSLLSEPDNATAEAFMARAAGRLASGAEPAQRDAAGN
ncbi:sodium:solute symporter family protein [Saccharopolyspora sp. NPDC002376]